MTGLFNLLVDGRISAKLGEPSGLGQQIHQLSDSINTANGELRAIRGLWEEYLRRTAELTLPQFQDLLPQTAEALDAAYKMNVTIPLTIKDAIQSKLRASNSSTPGYWLAVSEFIGYESLLRQKIGLAPDPEKTAKPCGLFTGGTNNIIVGYVVTDCIVDLDTETFSGTTFRNCVVRYKGGGFSLIRVNFVNCRFLFPPLMLLTKPVDRDFLLALLRSPDQALVTATNG